MLMFVWSSVAHLGERHTNRDRLKTFALQAGGEGGARLARKAGVPVSPGTLLRLLHTMIDGAVNVPRVLGVDDFALRRKSAATAPS